MNSIRTLDPKFNARRPESNAAPVIGPGDSRPLITGNRLQIIGDIHTQRPGTITNLFP